MTDESVFQLHSKTLHVWSSQNSPNQSKRCQNLPSKLWFGVLFLTSVLISVSKEMEQLTDPHIAILSQSLFRVATLFEDGWTREQVVRHPIRQKIFH